MGRIPEQRKTKPPEQLAEVGPGGRQHDVDRVAFQAPQEAPPHAMVALEMPDLRLDRTAAAAGQYTEFLNAVAAQDTYGLYNTSMWSSSYGCKIERSGSSPNYTYSVDSNSADRPVNYVSWGNAARFSNWLRNGQPEGTLTGDPTQDAWLTEDGAYCLNGAMSDAVLLAVMREADWAWAITSEDEWYKAAYHENDGVTGSYFDYPTSNDSTPGRDMTEATNPGNNANCYGSPYPIAPLYYATVAGESELSDSSYGTFDQGRNVGFRVSEVPEPATLSLLLFGGLVALRRRR